MVGRYLTRDGDTSSEPCTTYIILPSPNTFEHCSHLTLLTSVKSHKAKYGQRQDLFRHHRCGYKMCWLLLDLERKE